MILRSSYSCTWYSRTSTSRHHSFHSWSVCTIYTCLPRQSKPWYRFVQESKGYKIPRNALAVWKSKMTVGWRLATGLTIELFHMSGMERWFLVVCSKNLECQAWIWCKFFGSRSYLLEARTGALLVLAVRTLISQRCQVEGILSRNFWRGVEK